MNQVTTSVMALVTFVSPVSCAQITQTQSSPFMLKLKEVTNVLQATIAQEVHLLPLLAPRVPTEMKRKV